ncbi:hypothetical protein RHMOL_Rhmol05G0173000 [Rhododendron molle]|uniref:Uncharacterized protein n=1 Tax=Rhododendron molle TaxID=49168 RepID=A0ACC0NQD5_RHOML|nr:hypothetical protein RHMOL_Rhmol05G0173000 [Rhododendron molle]
MTKSEKGELWKEEREAERELDPRAKPRVFCVVFFCIFLLSLLLLALPERFGVIELKLLFDLEPESAERDSELKLF